jgi:hypothetical protein
MTIPDYSWIYNSSNPVPDKQRMFTVGEVPVQISAGGLMQCVDIYVAVGDCVACGPGDVVWAPLSSCGKAVQICPDNNIAFFSIPGKYSFGNPATPLVLTGDVNVRRNDLANLTSAQLEAISKKCSGPQEVTIVGPLPVPVADIAGNTLLTSILAEDVTSNTTLTSILAEDVASNTTLTSILAEDVASNALLTSILAAITAQKDYEYKSNVVCNEITNTWHELTQVYVDGVLASANNVDLGISCNQPQPIASDIEKIDYCDPTTKTIHIKVCRYDFLNPATPTVATEVVLSTTDTGIACNVAVHESISEVKICAAGETLYQKTILLSDGTQQLTYYGTNGLPVPAPASFTIGVCPSLAVPALVVESGGAQIAGDVLVNGPPVANPAFAGALPSWLASSITGRLQSISVTAFDTTPGLVGLTANQVTVAMPDGTVIALADGETRTYSVNQANDSDLQKIYNINAFGIAYATITYTYI